MSSRKVGEVMARMPIQAMPTSSVGEVAGLMRERGVGSALVVDRTGVVGLVTHRDLVARVLADDQGSDTEIGAATGGPPLCVGPGDDVDSVAAMMRARALRRVPVVEKGRAVGIVSLSDLAALRAQESLPDSIRAAGVDIAGVDMHDTGLPDAGADVAAY